MKKLFFAVAAMFALVSCGGGAAEDAVEMQNDFAEKLEVAVEDEEPEAVIEACKWVLEEAKAYKEKYADLEKESEDARERLEKAMEKVDDLEDKFTEAQKKEMRSLVEDMRDEGIRF